jgi:hypothetical protein
MQALSWQSFTFSSGGFSRRFAVFAHQGSVSGGALH